MVPIGTKLASIPYTGNGKKYHAYQTINSLAHSVKYRPPNSYQFIIQCVCMAYQTGARLADSVIWESQSSKNFLNMYNDACIQQSETGTNLACVYVCVCLVSSLFYSVLFCD